jgi:hypothetical protein
MREAELKPYGLSEVLELKHYKMTQSKRLFSHFTALLILSIANTMHCNKRLVNRKNSSLFFMPFYSASALRGNSSLDVNKRVSSCGALFNFY